MIPVGSKHAAWLIARAAKTVHCEKCDIVYAYEVTRHGTGEAFNPLFLAGEAAQKKCEEDAVKDVQRKLDQAIEVVPCPGCGWISEEMWGEARRLHLRRVKFAAIALLCALVIPFFMLYAATCQTDGEPVSSRMIIECVAMILFQVALAIGMLVGRGIACRGYNPNDEPVDLRLSKGRARAKKIEGPEDRD